MEWFVEIKGASLDLEELSKSLNSPELCIIQKGQAFFLKSCDFYLLKEAEEVRSRASEIIALINGAAKLEIGILKPLVVDSVVRVHDDGKREFFCWAEVASYARISVSETVVKADGTVQEIHPPVPGLISSLSAIAKNNTNVEDVIRRFGADLNWKNLYCIYEVIESDAGGKDNITKAGWATAKMINRFKYTANSPDAIGDLARHGKRRQPPKDPMTLPEARALITTIVLNWLNSKKIP